MKYEYTAPEPCRMGGVLVQKGDIWDWAEPPDRWWVPVVKPEMPKYTKPSVRDEKE